MAGVLRTVGHPVALAAIRTMLAGHAPHAVLLAGPPALGKTTLGLDLAAGLLCVGATGGDRPCRECRGCRLVEHGNHPDLHRLAPGGAGQQISIGGKDVRGIRDLVSELALLPVEGGWRVALIEGAHRMNDDAQSALLKTLEEPPAGATLILAADDEDRLLPTVRSRCVTVRLGPVPARDVERLVVDRGLADAPTGARLARLTGGRPGLALAYAAQPEAETIRTELVRTLLDLLTAPPSERLTAGRGLVTRAAELGALLTPKPAVEAPVGRGRRGAAAAATSETPAAEPTADAAAEPAEEEGSRARVPAAERRRALGLLIGLWRDLARDLAVVAADHAGASVREVRALEELERAAAALAPGAAADALTRLLRAGELLDANVSPELLLDVLLIRWPSTIRPAA
jgi:DNA polymerase III delta' subunit